MAECACQEILIEALAKAISYGDATGDRTPEIIIRSMIR